jgi:peroxiredoxin
LLIEVLNVFCFPCQTHALALSKAYEIIEDRQDLKGKIKIIGVALGNTKEAVDTFMSDYGLAFPVVSDPELLAEKIIGPGIHTPFSLFIRRDTSGKLGLVVETHDAAIEDPNILLNGLVKLLRMEPGSINFEELF